MRHNPSGDHFFCTSVNGMLSVRIARDILFCTADA